ncbi:hypothetical protein C8Q80DRAFT_469658 [Daedaleopsis nitida]|nr:hypothetical protein C8Q80DRAFT_469658 [Daedaleopsis nitida]
MSMSVDNDNRAPSRVGHRRPPLQRSKASYNLFPELRPIRTTSDPVPELEGASSDSDDSSSSEFDEKLTIHLAPLCPPSPPSPVSSSSQSSSPSPLFSPVDQEEWERYHDGFVPPPVVEEMPVSSWPATPYPVFPPPMFQSDVLELVHHGWSHNALYELKEALWIRRQWLWWHYEECCRNIESKRTDATEDGIAVTFFYPHPPVLCSSRRIPWMSANGVALPTTERVRVRPNQQAEAAWRTARTYHAPIYPRAGDIADLRDHACEMADRMFFSYPPNLIKKVLYVNEMDIIHKEHQQRGRRSAMLAPPSPLARCWTPDSPMSVYSQDSAALPSPLMPPSSQSSCTAAGGDPAFPPAPLPLLDTRWKSRWMLIANRIPPSPPPSAFRSVLPAHLQEQNSTSGHESRSDTALPDDATSPVTQELEEVVGVSTTMDEEIVLPAPADTLSSDDQPQARIFVHPPVPITVQAPTPVAASVPLPPSFIVRAPTPLPSRSREACDPVVRLPSRPADPLPPAPPPIPTAITATTSSHTFVSGPMEASPTVVDDPAADADDESDCVRFNIPRPSCRPDSPRFSFIVLED